jgi:hypothetical protein
MDGQITVIIPCHKRFRVFDDILKAWHKQPYVDEIIVMDNSGNFKTDLPNTLVISSSINLGPQGKYWAAQLAKNDIILFADDDVMPKNNLTGQLLEYLGIGNIVGIMGKCFTGDTYYESDGYRGWNIEKPIYVDYLCGLIMLMRKSILKEAISRDAVYLDPNTIDISRCPTRYMDDWWFQDEVLTQSAYAFYKKEHPRRKYKKGVIVEVTDELLSQKVGLIVPPLTKDCCEILPEDKDENALHLTKEIREIREFYFKKWVKNGN